MFRRRGRAAGETSEPARTAAGADTPAKTPDAAVTRRPVDLAELDQPPASRPDSRAEAPPARAWNLWELERRAREQAGANPRAEEWSALFTHLRVFANADGVLPKEFDRLVRESFGQLIEAA